MSQPPFVNPSEFQTQSYEGFKYDFNLGVRLYVPEHYNGKQWRIIIYDRDNLNILAMASLSNKNINSAKRYYINYRIEVYDEEDNKLIFEHNMDLKDKDVLINFPVGTVGDIIAWSTYAFRFQEKHGCRLTICMSPLISCLFKDEYKHITFLSQEEVNPDIFYASYYLGLFFEDKENNFQPCSFKFVGLGRTAGYILNVNVEHERPKISLKEPSEKKEIKKKYVCIAVQASMFSKLWLTPNGWGDVIRFLKENDYDVFVIDRDRFMGAGFVYNHIPNGAIDFTGNFPLTERAHFLKGADFFIGVSSGLSWLAWAVGIPVVLISSFTHPLNEFHTDYRVINYNGCNSCWNREEFSFDHKDLFWCPIHKNTERHIECTRIISPFQVIETIKKVTTFSKRGI